LEADFIPNFSSLDPYFVGKIKLSTSIFENHTLGVEESYWSKDNIVDIDIQQILIKLSEDSDDSDSNSSDGSD